MSSLHFFKRMLFGWWANRVHAPYEYFALGVHSGHILVGTHSYFVDFHYFQTKPTAKITKQSLLKNYATAMVVTANAEELEKLKLLA